MFLVVVDICDLQEHHCLEWVDFCQFTCELEFTVQVNSY